MEVLQGPVLANTTPTMTQNYTSISNLPLCSVDVVPSPRNQFCQFSLKVLSSKSM